MPWEKSFDESDVIESVMDVFWNKGYEATSISDLTEATGLKRGSLYNAFGDGKQELFFLSLQKYDQEQRAVFLKQLEAIESPMIAFNTLFDSLVQQAMADTEKKGCLLVNTALNITHYSEAVRTLVTQGMDEFASFFERLIKRGQNAGQIPETVQPRPTAKTLLTLVVGIRVMSRGVLSKAALKQVSQQAKSLIS
ncbi:TetR/AcrR family transcriptional regulator [Gimesia aquarii]|uniref:HTH-type transcriptional repressor ComR n=1 Tax=Gimesia aquarii TaxID=2527964 RepID=A0A517VSB1_9PLAN|nr:TetR/AcrR family transcriptional regulator [Gimesia aquarii]QDT95887.1 HTH-type transcriptional repressor ComR [Gimesia aquarii]